MRVPPNHPVVMDDYDILKPMMTRGSPLCLKNPPIIDHCYGDPAFYYHCYYEYHIIINIIIIMIYYGTLVLYISYIYISYIYILYLIKSPCLELFRCLLPARRVGCLRISARHTRHQRHGARLGILGWKSRFTMRESRESPKSMEVYSILELENGINGGFHRNIITGGFTYGGYRNHISIHEGNADRRLNLSTLERS